MDLTERTVESKTLFDGIIVTLKVDQAQLPDGKVATREVVEHPGAAWPSWPWMRRTTSPWCSSTATPSTRCCWSCPRASWTPGRTTAPPPIRELSEETGLEAGELTYLGCLLASPGFCTERLHMYLARDLRKKESHPDEDEFLNVITMPFQQLLEQVMDGTVEDAKTVATVLKTKVLLGL